MGAARLDTLAHLERKHLVCVRVGLTLLLSPFFIFLALLVFFLFLRLRP